MADKYEEAKKLVADRKELGMKFVAPWQKMMIQSDKMYNRDNSDRALLLKAAGLEGLTNLYSPLTFRNVEFMASKRMDTFYSGETFFDLRGFEESDDEAAKRLKQLLRYHFYVLGNSYINLLLWNKDTDIYGRGFVLLDWEYEIGNTIAFEPIESQENPEYIVGWTRIKQPYVKQDNLRFTCIDPYYTWFDGTLANSVRNMEWFGFTQFMSKTLLKQYATQQGVNMGDIAKVPKCVNTDQLDNIKVEHKTEEWIQQRLTRRDLLAVTALDDHSDTIPVDVYYQKYPKSRLIWVAGDALSDGIVVHDGPIPRIDGEIPIADAACIPIPHQYICENIPGAGAYHQHLDNDLTNTRVDEIKKSLSGMYLVEKNVILPATNFVFGSGRATIVKRIAGVKELQVHGATTQSYLERKDNRDQSDEVFGFYGGVTGADIQARITATSDIMRTRAGLPRVNTMTRIFEETGTKRLIELAISLLQQNMSTSVTIRILGKLREELGEDSLRISPQEIIGRYDILSLANSLNKTEIRKKQALDGYNLFYGKPEFNNYVLSDEAREALEYSKRIMAPKPGEVAEQVAGQPEISTGAGPISPQTTHPGLPSRRNIALGPQMLRSSTPTLANISRSTRR